MLDHLSYLITESSILAEEKEEYDVTGTKIYQESCKTLGIIPASHFIRILQAQGSQINMSHHGVGPKGAKAIAIALTVSLVFIQSMQTRYTSKHSEKQNIPFPIQHTFIYSPTLQ